MATQVPQIRAGAIRPIAVTSAARSNILPDVPTVAESGFVGFTDHTWFSFLAPAGTPICTVLIIMAFFRHLRTFREICHGKRIGIAI
jgi:tripartite-type tricarboxylate transporter receptor subunit TctC